MTFAFTNNASARGVDVAVHLKRHRCRAAAAARQAAEDAKTKAESDKQAALDAEAAIVTAQRESAAAAQASHREGAGRR